MLFNNKKGVNPIIASILLIVVTVTVGAGAMAFIRNLSQTNLETATLTMSKVSCASEVEFAIKENFCINGSSYLRLFVTNNGIRDIEEFRIVYFNTDSVDTFTVSSSQLNVSQNIAMTHDTTTATSTIESIQIQPVIMKEGTLNTKVYCEDVSWEEKIGNIGTC